MGKTCLVKIYYQSFVFIIVTPVASLFKIDCESFETLVRTNSR
jgi:hypothetical protein